jgi:hypothetical protein
MINPDDFIGKITNINDYFNQQSHPDIYRDQDHSTIKKQ